MGVILFFRSSYNALGTSRISRCVNINRFLCCSCFLFLELYGCARIFLHFKK